MKRLIGIIVLVVGVLLFASFFCACGGASPSLPDGNSADRTVGEYQIQAATLTKDYYKGLLAVEFNNMTSSFGLADTASETTAFLNFGGGFVEKGFGAGRSYLLCGDSVSFPATSLGEDAIVEIYDAVNQHFLEAAINISITNVQPTVADYTTIFIGGTYNDLGCSGKLLKGISPFDVGNVSPSDVGFVFSMY